MKLRCMGASNSMAVGTEFMQFAACLPACSLDHLLVFTESKFRHDQDQKEQRTT